MMETDKTSVHWAAKCNEMSAIFVPSTFNLVSFMQSNITVPLRVVQLGIDFDKYTPEGDKFFKQLSTKFNFLCVGQWIQNGDRKNIQGVIRTFLNVFKENPDVGLILKTYMVGAGTVDKMMLEQNISEIRHQLGIKPDQGPIIYLVHGALSENDLVKLYRNADAFVLPSSGEAWGMPLMEAAAMNVPIITTAGTGAETFLNPDYCAMISYEWKPLGGNRSLWPGVYDYYQQFAIPDMNEFAKLMEGIYTHNVLAKENAVKQRQEILDRDFSWKHSAEIFTQTIEEICQ
jgi:hypothetical protein